MFEVPSEPNGARSNGADRTPLAPRDDIIPAMELPRVPRPLPRTPRRESMPVEMPDWVDSRAHKRDWRQLFRRSRSGSKTNYEGDGVENVPGTALAAYTPNLQPIEQTPPPKIRKSMKPLPWGRDFAAATIHRDDTLTAIFGKLDAADSPCVALVLPRGNQELSKPLGMRRLRRHVDVTGKDVMLVTHAGGLRARAREVGLTVVGSTKAVDFERYGRNGVKVGGVLVPLPGLGMFIRFCGLAAGTVALAAVILLYLPTATVQVYPQLTLFSSTSDILLSTDATVVNAAGGEVPAHRRSTTITRTVPFPVHGQATVKGPEGRDQNVPAPTDDDLKQGAQFAQQVLMDQGRTALAARYTGETLFPQTASVSALDIKPNVKANEPADLLEITATGQVVMLSADNESLQAILKRALQGKVDGGQMFVPETFTATPLAAGNFDKANNRLQTRVKLSEGVTRAFSLKRLQQAVSGKGIRDAQQAVVERVDEVQPAKIKLNPGWAPWLPRFTSRITVKVSQVTVNSSGDTAGASASATPTPAAR